MFVIDYQQRNSWNSNSKVMILQKYKCVIDYQKPAINYQRKNSEKAFWKDTSLQTILKRHDGPIYMCVWFQEARERYSRRTSLSNVLSTTLGQTLANLLRVHPGTSNYIIYPKGEKSFCSSQKVNCNQETGCLLNCKFPEHKGKRFLGCFRSCKNDFYKDSKKSQVGCLRTGCRHEK